MNLDKYGLFKSNCFYQTPIDKLQEIIDEKKNQINLSGKEKLTTNNRMELLAVIVGLEKLKNPKTKVLVVSDSKYVVDAVEKRWVFQWEKINFKAKKNPDLWLRFLKIYRQHQVVMNP